ncbi:MAG: hypothetical protein JSS54_17655 [Proteobacteria bacterium]|nr:hypothetical protein [Pseudomonadota bacterium]MBS0270785.1 hypothetical protein [Pseudomonadota bacterium]
MRADLSIIATRRPRLLPAVFKSFERYIFPKVDIAHVVANVDPVFDSERNQAAAIATIRRYFPTATLFEPDNWL